MNMSFKRILFLMLLVSFKFYSVNAVDNEKCVRGASQYGFFADFLWAVNHLHYCIINNKVPVIYWGTPFSYYHKDGYRGSSNGWEYYFEPVSALSYKRGDHLHTESFYKDELLFTALCWYVQYIDNMHLLTEKERASLIAIDNHKEIYLSNKFSGQRKLAYPMQAHPYSTTFRSYVKEIILNEFVILKPHVKNILEAFYKKNMENKKVIGIHLRGSFVASEVLDVPHAYIFKEANKHASDGVQFFVATDQYPLLEEAKKKLNGPVIFYDCERFEKTTSPHPHYKATPKMGEDVLVETLLLSKCDHLIHTLSNVSTAALYFNPNLEHTLLY